MDETDAVHDRFEDLDDMFDSILEEVSFAVHKWILLAKVAIEDDPHGVLAKEVFFHVVSQELEEQYPKTFPVVKKTAGGTIISGCVRKKGGISGE